jgi:hypothetical protein
MDQKPHLSVAWDVGKLIEAALAQNPQDRLSKHIQLPADAQQSVPTNGWPAGTSANPREVTATVAGRMGDVIEIDAKRQLARALIGLPPADEVKEPVETNQAVIDLMYRLDVKLPTHEKLALTQDNAALKLAVDNGNAIGADGKYLQNQTPDNLSADDVFWLVPDLTAEDLTSLRSGRELTDKYTWVSLNYSFTHDFSVVTVEGKKLDFKKNYSGQFNLTVVAQDYERGNAVFFGDRPLENPGYSKFTLNGSVGIGQGNNVLDVYRVEQRLKYLGFCSFDKTITGDPVEFEVDGILNQTSSTPGPHFSIAGSPEEGALRVFYAMTHHGASNNPNNADNSWGGTRRNICSAEC